MDGQTQPEEKPVAEAPAPKPHRSFMDIHIPKAKPKEPPKREAAPEAPKTDAPAAASAEKPESKPAESSPPAAPAPAKPEVATDVAVAPPEEADDPAEKLEAPKAKAVKPPKPPKPPRQPGVGLAIFATVVIILGLGAMATYAYLKSKNIAPF